MLLKGSEVMDMLETVPYVITDSLSRDDKQPLKAGLSTRYVVINFHYCRL